MSGYGPIVKPARQAEIMDLIAEAAKVSPHAAKAYELLRVDDPDGIMSLAARQRLIEARGSGVPL